MNIEKTERCNYALTINLLFVNNLRNIIKVFV